MRISSKEFYGKMIAPLGIKIEQKFNIKQDIENPHHILYDFVKDTCKLVNSLGDMYPLGHLLDKEIELLPRTKEQIHARLKELAGDWKPDWSNRDQPKYCIVYDHINKEIDYRKYEYTKHSYNMVYFKTLDDVENTMNEFTDEEWKIYFEVE